MDEAVSSILIGRSREADGLTRMVLLSLVAHGVFVTALALMPGEWWRSAAQPELAPMMISLGGAPGPNTGGLTQMSSRPVQNLAPPESKPDVTPPAAKVPEMVAPEPDVKPLPKPASTPVEKPVEKSATRKPSTGPEVRSGAARVETGGVAVPFGGLSQSGSDSTGGPKFDVANFCCPDYANTMTRLIRSNWDQQQGAAGQSIVKFTIRRDGMLTNVEVFKSSGNPLLDLESRRAVLNTRQLPPLPEQFTRPTLTVYLTFDYKR
jgi:periplasmic protein TonB